MKKSHKLLVGSLIAITLVVGVFAITFESRRASGTNKEYKKLIKDFNVSIKSLRYDDVPSQSISSALASYNKVVKSKYENEIFDNQQSLIELDNKIDQEFRFAKAVWDNYEMKIYYKEQSYRSGQITWKQFQSFKKQYYEEAKELCSSDYLRDLRFDVSRMSDKLNVSLPLAYGYPALVIFILGVSLAFLVTLLCRKIVDWRGLESAREKIDEWKDKMSQAKRKKGKKRRKLEYKDDEAVAGEKFFWAETIKQAFFYFAPFFVFSAWLGYVYADWVVAWLPFDILRSVEFVGLSLGYFAWFLVVYFVFCYLWRLFFIKEEG